MDFVITVQYMENYNYDTPGEGEDYFKFKGDINYRVTAYRIQDAVIEVLNHCQSTDNEMCKTFPTSWSTYEEWVGQLPEDPEYRDFKLECLRTLENELGR